MVNLKSVTPEACGMDLGDPGTASDPLGLFCVRLKRLQTQ
jgi:hypothetical protein